MISRRSLELITAALTGTFGAAVAISSLDNGIGWSRSGVDAGTFPFITGVIILAGSLFNLIQGALQDHAPMLGSSELQRVGGLLVPAAIYVGMIPLLGMYVASAAYVFGTFALQGRVSALRSLIGALIVAVSLYLLFERMFQVALPRGLLGDALGF
jgi:hypothetical protein